MRSRFAGIGFILPWLIGFAVLVAFPFVASLYYSFCRYDVMSPPTWIGLANYRELLFDDPVFWTALGNTLLYAVISVPLGVVTAFALALLLNLELRGMAVYRTIFFLPSIIPAVATSVVFTWILNPQLGLANTILQWFGVQGPAWLQDPVWAMRSLIMLSLWGVGGSMITYLAGLKDAPVSLYEAAQIDGANAWQRVIHITIPLMTPVIFFNLVMGVINAFQYFTQAYIMTQGGPGDSTRFFALYLFERAWRYLDMGYASAMAWILFVVLAGITWLLFRSQRAWVHHDG